MDLTGGVLSFGQQFLDSYNTGNWGTFTNNLPKVLIAIVTIVFDLIFMFQQFVLYPQRERGPEAVVPSDPLNQYRSMQPDYDPYAKLLAANGLSSDPFNQGSVQYSAPGSDV